MEKFNKNYKIYGGLFLIALLTVSGFYIYLNQSASKSITGNSIDVKSKMTEFDVQLAKKLMDKNNDGKCDYCGMDVEMCIDSGMMECTMNSEAKIGLLGSAHEHADFMVYIEGEEIDFNQEKYFVKSAFVHIEPELNNGETGKILHIHAKGIPLWLFFESLGMKFNLECFEIDDKQFCNNENNRLRLFVNDIENYEFGNYVPKNLDKILITYGNKDVNNLIVSDYSKDIN